MLPLLGFCNLMVFGGYAIYFPELYPTRLRSTGTGFCYNVARYIAAVGPLVLPMFISAYGKMLGSGPGDPNGVPGGTGTAPATAAPPPPPVITTMQFGDDGLDQFAVALFDDAFFFAGEDQSFDVIVGARGFFALRRFGKLEERLQEFESPDERAH